MPMLQFSFQGREVMISQRQADMSDDLVAFGSIALARHWGATRRIVSVDGPRYKLREGSLGSRLMYLVRVAGSYLAVWKRQLWLRTVGFKQARRESQEMVRELMKLSWRLSLENVGVTDPSIVQWARSPGR